jgi:molecular chaperone DnaK (HSP70)
MGVIIKVGVMLGDVKDILLFFKRFITCNIIIPTKKSQMFSITNVQTKVEHLSQSISKEHKMAIDNKIDLGHFDLVGIPYPFITLKNSSN